MNSYKMTTKSIEGEVSKLFLETSLEDAISFALGHCRKHLVDATLYQDKGIGFEEVWAYDLYADEQHFI